MPIRREHRYFYPIDWKQLLAEIRFVRAKSRCEGCAAGRICRTRNILATAAGGI